MEEREKNKIKFLLKTISLATQIFEKLEPLISQKIQTCLFQLETRLTDELNFKNKYELLKIELETCKTELLASKSREIELSESLHKYEVRANNSCLRGQDGEAQMMCILAKMLPNYIQDTHLTAHSGHSLQTRGKTWRLEHREL